MKIASLAIVLTGIATAGLCQDGFPIDWHIAGESSAFRLHADIDGNGTVDEAVLLTDGRQVKLLTFLEDKVELRVLDLLTTTCAPGSCAIKLMPAGEYLMSCGDSLFECRSSDRAMLRTKRPSLALSAGDSDVLFLFEKDGVRKIQLIREP